jgi:2-oxo-hept-3-ene-1,7-dioate hydratase
MELTLTGEQIEGIAAEHERARRTATPFRRVTLTHPDMTIGDAYAIQQAWVDLQVGAGGQVIGHKIGLTSRAMQQAMSIDEPDFGVLLDHMVIDDGATVRAVDFVDPKLEVELAFVLRDRIDSADVTAEDVLAATEHVVPALELIDARSYRRDPDDGVTRTVRDTIADNAANAGIVTGARRVRPAEIELRWVPAVLTRNGIVEETGVAAGVLGDPVKGIVWLARRLHSLGVALEPGQIVLAGSFTRPVDCRAGDRFEADFGDLGVVRLAFE